MHEITFDYVKKYMDTTLVLKNVSFQINDGDIVGIIGDNGSGKTTILKLIAGILKLNHCAGYPYAPVPPGYDEGFVKISKATKCSYLEQISQYENNLKVLDVLKLSFKEIYELEEKMRELEKDMTSLEGLALNRTLEKYSELMQLYEVKGGYETQEKLSKICSGLKLDENLLNQDFHLLSGGERTRVLLGKLLVDPSDVLLLDEPTNHLDMDSVEWLEEFIKSYKGIVIVVSHDRYFLDHITSKIIEIENKISMTYNGNYSNYILQKEEELRIQGNKFKEQQKTIANMEQSIKELREWANKADNNKFFKRAASMQIKLDKLEKIDKPIVKKHMNLDIKTGERSGNLVIKAYELDKSFEDKVLFHQAELLIQYGERVAMIGPNGCGKSTFIKMLLGELTPECGEVILGANVKLAYLPQNVTFEDEDITVLDYFREDISILLGKAREHLAKFMFYGNNVFKKVKYLSGGERYRLKLSKLLFTDVNLLILDEPTNHLDITSIERIEEALTNFKGTIFFVSHDRYFINKIADKVISIENNRFKAYLGNYDYFKHEKDKQKLIGMNESASAFEIERNKGDKGLNTEKSKDSYTSKYDKKANSIEKTLNSKCIRSSKLEDKIKEVELKINDMELEMELVSSDYEELSKLYAKKEELSKELEGLIAEWISI